ncbi:protein UPSTREAM OF FLC-like [Dorcoceras hygrometricum]|uniref:Protein UPSTREAM OF FLC-like n=1 Tax=Dorcoceras hygrometricum TaxID=472368 RepID=A0A2Z7D539_9LAMI|nr:protein UPSTREAM OF FLC-like [Dorcoceras hygrometricum]
MTTSCKRAVNQLVHELRSALEKYVEEEDSRRKLLLTNLLAVMIINRLALMTSLVTSSQSADELREQSQDSADSADAPCVDIQQSQDTNRKLQYNQLQVHPVASNSSSSRELLCTSCCYESRRKMMYQSRATVDPVARFIQSTRYDGSSRELQYYASSRKDFQTQ